MACNWRASLHFAKNIFYLITVIAIYPVKRSAIMNIRLKPCVISHYAAVCAAAILCLAALIGAVWAAPAAAGEAQPGKTAANDKIMPRYYHCFDHNVRLPVTYIETAGGNFYAVLLVEGKQIAMVRQAVRQEQPADKSALQKYYYLSLDEEHNYRWYPEGDKGRLSFIAADNGAGEHSVYESCQVLKDK
ncbi:hypothetical protein DPQ22_06465 [Candidatus Tokpelaia sp.]|nr:hypothetical protein DPQ22_06465 [Candidatus Tokpelaia sp.]